MLEEIKEKILRDEPINKKEAIWIGENTDKEELYETSHQITNEKASKHFDMCSIINAKSGLCSENCKWCAQSAYHKTEVDVYELMKKEDCLKEALHNEMQGVERFSLVTSGKRLSKEDMKKICNIFSFIHHNSSIKLCASLGLLDKQDMIMLKQSGVKRYHCNLETSPSFFDSLCSTHSLKEKINTINAAKETGLEICCGGIIGMGESLEQRIELAFTLRELEIDSIPINLLQAIKGTALENTPPLKEDEILTTIALFRLINPKAFLRFAGGRAQMSKEAMEKSLYVGINSAIVGDMLTTIGCNITQDKQMISKYYNDGI